MKFPTVSSCCCCVDLKPAGIVLGVLGIAAALLNISTTAAVLPNLCTAALSVLWLFGVIKERPSFLLPNVIIGFIGLIFCYLMPIVVFLIAFFESKEFNFKKQFGGLMPVYIAIYIILVALSTYLWVVQYSVYKHIKEVVQSRLDRAKPQV